MLGGVIMAGLYSPGQGSQIEIEHLHVVVSLTVFGAAPPRMMVKSDSTKITCDLKVNFLFFIAFSLGRPHVSARNRSP
jgi:hypothetical protein